MKSATSLQRFSTEFKKEAVALVTEQGYSYAKAAQAIDTSENNLRRWQKELELETTGESLSALERAELVRLRRGNKEIRMEKAIQKKGLLCERNEVKYDFIRAQQSNYPVRLLCRMMSVSPRAFMDGFAVVLQR